MAFPKFPYTDFHRLNADWIIEQVKAAEQAVRDAKAEVDAAVAIMEGYDEHLSILDQGVSSNANQIQTVAANLSTLAGTVATQGDRINSINTGLTDLASHAVQTYEQEFSDAEKAQARTNIGAVALSAYNTNNNRVNAILEYQGNQISALAPVTFTLNDSGTWPAQSIPEANRAAILLAKNTLVNKTTLVYATITQQTYQELPSGFIVAMVCVGDNILSGTFEQAYYDAVNQEYGTVSATITVDTVHWTWDMSCKYGTDVTAADIVNATASMTASQQEQTRENIGAASKNDVSITETSTIPGSFSAATNKATLTLSNYSGKKISISNRNLLPQFTEMTDHGITCTKNADGSISLSGTANGTAVITITTNEFTNLGPGVYALSCGNSEAFGDSNTYINVAIDGTYAAIYARFNTVDGKTTFTVPDGSRATAIRIRISSGATIPANFKCYPQITEGTEFISFVPHDGFIITPTSETLNDVNVFAGYTYIGAQSGASGIATYDVQITDLLANRITTLEPIAGRFIGKKIVCFGDSIFANFQKPYDIPSMIANLTGATVYNAAFGGCCMSDNNQTRKLFSMCRLVDAIVAGDFTAQRNSGVSITYAGTSINYVPDRITMLEGIDWSQIDYITISYGTNDWNSNYALDNMSNPNDTTTYIGAFRYSIEKLLSAYPNIKILPITPLWRFWDTDTGMPSEIQGDYIDSNTYTKGTGYRLWEYGDALVEAAKDYQIPVFDIYPVCMMNKYNRHQYFDTTDGTHPKLEGRKMMSGMITGYLNKSF